MHFHIITEITAKEIDLLLEGDSQLYPIELKKTAAPEKK